MVLLVSCILWLGPINVFAVDATVTFTVNATADQIDDDTSDGLCHTSANTCSLRAAVMQANHLSTNGEVEINLPPGIYRLTLAPVGSNGEASGDLNFTTPPNSTQRISILGTNPSITVIDANHTDRAISVAAGGNAGIGRLTVRNGNDSSVGGVGGGYKTVAGSR